MKKLLPLIFFSIAFGFVEASVVIYLRQLLGFQTGYLSGSYHTILNLGAIAFITTSQPLLKLPLVSRVEVFREFSTIVMLASISWFAGKSAWQRLGAFLISFALWDIFYYIFLAIFIGWPKSLFDIDVYFLIPVIWIGPIITPVLASICIGFLGLFLFQRVV